MERANVNMLLSEGILNKIRYGNMLHNLIDFYDGKAFTYYFDLTFEETVKRHNTRDKKLEFGEDAMRSWWIPNDYLGVAGERKLTNELSHKEVVKLIVKNLEEEGK